MRAAALATVAGIALAGPALAQKPPVGAAPQQALPTAKPPPLGAPMQAQPAPRTAPAQPPVVQAVPPAAPAQPPMIQPIPRTAPGAQATAPIPANEPAAVTRLRGLLRQGIQLSYAGAEALDGAGERVRLTGVVLQQGSTRATAEEALISGLREDGVAEAVIRGFATAEAGMQVRIAALRVAGLTVPRNAAGGPPQPDQVRLDQIRIEGVEATGDNPVRMRSFSVENWIAGQPARVNLEGLEIGGLAGGFVDAMRIARFAMTGVDFGTAIAAVMAQRTPPSLVGRASMEMDGLVFTGGGRPVGGMQEMRIAADVTRPDGSGTGMLALRGIRVEPVPMVGEWLTRFGYQAVDADITGESTYDAASGRMEIRDLTIAGRDVGSLSFALNMAGVTTERLQANDFSQLRLVSMGLRYADASLFRRFIAMQARETRTPEPQLREQFAQMVGGALTEPGAAALDPVRNAIQAFIRGQAQTVEIRVNPPQPLGMEQMQGAPPSPAEAQRLLGITATAR
jgi:hypothetical protein